ncbi:hypothetical protein N7456_006675 [Penicillium angulare]|uniref:Rad21/Rec8-like protein N-terminal domain-containing protein n=1 Tax=Penicillium angulare TaxID=116970 RepID=A0A9W9FIA8_9EURO|nr:hypothetical protein N7456_006675 [Penicillium angulare]
MFYSHEILTSPEHGVATIWLVATLGSRSITRRVNRKAILEVDVPEACRVIVNPQAPMALRLQGNLLYGVSRVYHQQCGYTLLDAQAMHDKMLSMLKMLPGGGLDPQAGKTKPSSLLIPYDPSFMPETNLPGLNIDFSLLDITVGENMSQKANLWAKSPPTSNSSASRLSINLDLGSDDILRDGDGDILDIVNEGAMAMSTRKRSLFGMEAQGILGNEEGVLLQPDFEFDENGAIVEFDASHLSPRKRRKFSAHQQQADDDFVVLGHNEDTMDVTADVAFVRDRDGDIEMTKLDNAAMHEQQIIDPGEEPLDQSLNQTQNQSVEDELLEPVIQRQVRHRTRIIKYIDPDTTTTVRNSDLAQWNNEYTSNMAYASYQKQQNKIQTTSKKNAAFYVYGQGIGSVGNGLGQNKHDHPLKCFSGISLFNSLCEESEQLTTPKKPGRPSKDPDPDTEVETDTEVARTRNGGPGAQNGRMNSLDIEIGRHAPSSLLDEHSSLMPWNITASAQSSRIARLGSLSDLSAKLGEPSLLRNSHSRRLTSASPLAGRGYASERQGSLYLLGDDGLGLGGDFFNEDLEITRYLEGELAPDNESIQALSRRVSAIQRVAGELDQESLNFFEFIQEKMEVSEGRELEMRFSELLSPESTSRVVATQGLMNVLTLATKGVLRVRQEKYRDGGVEVERFGERYQYGEIFMRM